MARPPAGPIGNAPRDVRDDAVGVPADDIKTGEPPRWPTKPKKITSNTFHAKVSGNTPPKRVDRSPHYRKGGWVKGYALGGAVAAQVKRDKLPGEQKNDPTDAQNLRGKPKSFKGGGLAGYAGLPKKRQEGGDVPLPKPDPRYNIGDAEDLEPGIAKTWNTQMGRIRGIVRGDKQPWDKRPDPTSSGPVRRKSGGGVKKLGQT